MGLRSKSTLAAVLVLALGMGDRVRGNANQTPVPSASTARPSLNGEIVGRVLDAAGSPLPGVAVTAKGPALIGSRTTTTTPAGRYRLAELPVGLYTITFESRGFATQERGEIRLDAGVHAQIDARLDRSSDRETATVSSDQPLFDTRSAAIVTNATGEWLELLPAGQDPRAFVQMAPGITMSAEDVGGNALGRQAAPYVDGRVGRGWTIDGNVGSLQGIQVLRAGTDASFQDHGVAVNLIARSGSNRFKGSARYTFTDWRLQSDNLTPELEAEGAGFGNPVRRISEAVIEMGGPIRRDKAWLWGSASYNAVEVGLIGFYTPTCLNTDGSPVVGAAHRAECMNAGITTLPSLNARLQYRWASAHRSTVSWARPDRRQPNRGASAYTRPESTTRQSSLSSAQPFQAQHQWVVSDRFVLDGTFTFSDASFILDFQDPSLADVQGAYDRYTLVHSRSGAQSEFRRPTTNIVFTGSHLLAGFLGGDHATRFGIEILKAPRQQWDRTGGGAVAVFDSRGGSPVSYQARIFRDGLISLDSRQYSAFFHDAYTRGRVTINGGMRFDHQDDAALEATIPANRILPDLLPAVRFPGADSGVEYNDVSPRLGLAWDVTGRATTVLKATAARYWGIGNASSAPLQPTRQTRLVYWWNDANHDGFVQTAELDLARGLAATPTSNYDAANPGSVRSPATVDQGLENDVTDQLTLGFEHHLARGVALRATYVGRKMHQLQATFPINADGSLVSSDTYDAVRWAPANCPPGAECPAVTYYQRSAALPPGTVLRNDGEYAWHHGVDLVLHKRMADGWTMEVSLAWNAAVRLFPRRTFDYTDPTNIDMRNGFEYSPLESHWIVKSSGSARMPLGFTTSGVLTARQGFPYARGVTSPNRGALGSTIVEIKPYGSERYQAVCRLDWRIERPFKAGRIEVIPLLDVFNALNSNVVLTRNRLQNTQSANGVTEILAPRSVHLDLRIGW